MSASSMKETTPFIGRKFEQAKLFDISKQSEASSIIVYGRRRVGKTELLEQTFKKRNILKFEGVEGEGEDVQREFVIRKLAAYTGNPLLKKLKVENWLDVFDAIHEYTKKGKWTVYFEEVQWLANYKDHFVNQLKTAWDNAFRYNPKLIVILCGSSPSFMIKQVVHSKSFYNRSQYEIHLKEFSLIEAKEFLSKHSNREVMNAYLTIGGIPEYLKRLKKCSSIFLGICEQSFLPDGYFTKEYKRIFISSMKESPYYESIILFLSRCRFATREEIAKYVNLEPGGRLSNYLEELEYCGFINKYQPYHLSKQSKLSRYEIADAYLQFYFKFIEPELDNIEMGRYVSHPTDAIKADDYHQWLGYSFERYCRRYAYVIAEKLGFSGVKYKSGAFYNRKTNQSEKGYQIDLLFDRTDHVLTICEIKYTQTKVGVKVIDDFERKLELFENKKNKTIQKILISADGAQQAVIDRHYFDRILTTDDLFKS